MKIRNILGSVALSIGAILIALVLGEIILRMFFKDDIALFPRFQTDARYGDFTIRRVQPDTTFWHTSVDGIWKFTTNKQGFRNERDFTYEKSPDVMRIITLGDSHTQGFEVRQDQTYAAVIERYLLGEGMGAEVINAGVSGFSTAEALVFLENEGIKYQPDIVVLGFYANDLADNLKAGIFALDDDGELVIKKYEHIPGVKIQKTINKSALVRWLSQNSYVYSFGFNNVWIYYKKLTRNKAKADVGLEYAVAVDEVNDYQVKLESKLIERMYAFAQENNIKLVIIDIPRRHKEGEMRSSVPPELYESMAANSDLFLYSKDTLYDYRNVLDFHVPNGQNHISEPVHAIFGVEIGRWLTGSAHRQRQELQ